MDFSGLISKLQRFETFSREYAKLNYFSLQSTQQVWIFEMFPRLHIMSSITLQEEQ